MKLKNIVIGIALAGVAGGSSAQEIPLEEKRGAIAGMVAGAAVGGPFGAGVGAMLGGGVIGKVIGMNRQKNERIDELQTAFARNRDQKREMEQEVSNLNRDLDRMIELQTNSWRHQEIPIQFRTGESRVEPHYLAQLEKIAKVLSRNQDATITLSGFADRRGSETANQALSKQRVDKVRALLVRRGVKPNQILSKAYGESKPLNGAESLESNFFDRRVVMALSLDVDAQLATR
jgi:sortase system peptidoglycan-associated protein